MDPEGDAVQLVASLMAVSARTAPKGKGTDTIVTRVLTGIELSELGDEMKRIGEKVGYGFFIRDSGNMINSQACLLIGCKGMEHLGLNCGGCGYSTCVEMLDAWKANKKENMFQGPNCVIRMADLGVAVGSAVKTAQIHNVDNRVFFSAGVAALSLGLLPGCTTAYGVPLSATGKSIFFDR